MVFVKATPSSEAGTLPSRALIEAMGQYNQQRIAAGVMKEAAGLRPTAKAARVTFSGKDRTVSLGPFANIIRPFYMPEDFAGLC